jgi:hypothetical protein
MSKASIIRKITEGGYFDHGLLLADGFEEAFMGVTHLWAPCEGGGATRSVAATYDHDECIQILMDRDGMSYPEAMECFSFNTLDAFVGVTTPVFLERMT